MDWLIVGLMVLGGALVVIEMFVPGIVLGVLGAMALLAAVVLAYVTHGLAGGTILLCAVGLAGIGGFLWWLRAFPRTFIGRKLGLESSIKRPADFDSLVGLLGKEGRAITTLRPAGTAHIEGRRFDVLTDGEFIASGDTFTVVHVEGPKIVVRKR